MGSVMHPACRSQLDLERLIPMTPTGGWRGERIVYQFFRDYMPSDWHVFWNVPFSNDDYAGNQVDFLVCIPGKGLVNVDAKGLGYELKYKDEYGVELKEGKVYCGGEPRDIIAEARGGRAAIDAFVRETRHLGPRDKWGAFDYLILFARSDVVLPETAKTDGFSLLNWERNPQGKAAELKACIEARLDKYKYNHSEFSKHWTPLLEAFGKCQKPFVANSKFAVWNDRAEKVLTSPQAEVYSALRDNRFCHVQGAAGTGKTLIAMLLAKAYAADRKRVLYVCFNKDLATYLKALGEPKGVKITHYHQIHKVFGVSLKFGAHFDRDAADAEIQKVLATLPATKKFDVVLVDEAQDLRLKELLFLTTLIQESGRIVLFSDENQNIFNGPREENGWEGDEEAVFEDEKVVTLPLRLNYRNTEPICDHFSRNGLKAQPYWTRFNLGEEPKPVQENIKRPKMMACLYEVLERVPPCQIAILGYNSSALDGFKDFRDIHGRQIRFSRTIEEWLHGNSILCTTVQGFKGIDAEVVFLLGDSTCSYDRLKYIGESRAKYELYIVE